MKTMTCKQLGGACDLTFQADTFDEIAEMSKQHGMAMFQQQDQAHLKAITDVQLMMQKPGAMQDWFASKRREFDDLPED